MTAALLLTTAGTTTSAENPIIGKNQIELQNDKFTPEALWAMGRIGSVVASPNSEKVVYTVSYYSVQQNKSRTTLYIMNADGTENTLLTTSASSEYEPAFIKNGSKIAYLSADTNGLSQLWEMNLDGSERTQLTTESADILGFKFSPNEKNVILIKEVDTYTSIEKKHDDLPLSSGMVITDLNYKHWDKFVTTIPHIFLASFDGQKVSTSKDILEGEPFECPMLPFGGSEQFSWSPDSKKIVYTCRKKVGVAYAISTDSDIYLYHIETGITTNLCKDFDYRAPKTIPSISLEGQKVNHQEYDLNMGYDTNPQYSPDGSRIAWQSMERDGYESDRTRLCVLELSSGKKTYVTEAFESGVDAFCWDTNNKNLYFIGVWHGTTMVYSTDLKGNVKKITDGDYDYASIGLCGKQLIAKRHSLSAPDDIYSIRLSGKKPATVTQLTQENKYFTDHITMGDVKARWVNTTDGKQELCWVVYPPHFDPTKKYPTLLFCQGGPQSPVSQFWSYRWNFQIMASNGYIVVAPNRRGLPGFGMEWLEAISGDYTGGCMQDYLDAIDDICKESYVDKERLGCVGASFGGYSVYWLAGHHEKRFKCFISHDGIFNTQQQYVETEEMWFPNWDFGAAPWHKGITAPTGKQDITSVALIEKPGKSNAFKGSPHLYVDRWDTPILCIHGDKDYRILSSQGQSAFNAARLRGLPAELLLYPDENHWVLKPQNGVLWQRTFFRWLERWLKK